MRSLVRQSSEVLGLTPKFFHTREARRAAAHSLAGRWPEYVRSAISRPYLNSVPNLQRQKTFVFSPTRNLPRRRNFGVNSRWLCLASLPRLAGNRERKTNPVIEAYHPTSDSRLESCCVSKDLLGENWPVRWGFYTFFVLYKTKLGWKLKRLILNFIWNIEKSFAFVIMQVIFYLQFCNNNIYFFKWQSLFLFPRV